MLSIDLAKFFRRPVLLVSSLFILGGCLPSSEPDVPDERPNEPPVGTTTMHRLTGSVGDGPITNAELRVTASDGRLLVTTTSTATASYDISVETEATDYPLAIIATGGTDLVTVATPDFDMKSVVKNSGENSVANLNPFTTIAIELASDLQNGITAANVDSAMQIVVREMNSGLSTLSGSAALQSPVSGSNIAELVRASEALGELVRRTRDALAAAGQSESGNSIVAALGSDLTDGKLDGRGGPRANARIAAVAGVVRGQIAIETMRNQLRVQGTDGTARIAAAMGQVFVGSINPGLADLRVTAELLTALRVGTTAAQAIQPSSEFATLLAEVAGLSSGMTSTQVRQAVSGDARTAFDTGILAVASASAAEIEMINEVLRTGSAPEANTAPVISGAPAGTASVGVFYDFRPTASDIDGDTLTFSISGRPGWATFSATTGRLRGTPQAADVGSYQGIVISVSDGQETAALSPFTLTVETVAGNTAPTISGSPPTQVTAGLAYSFQPSAADADGDALSFSIFNKPVWATFSTASGRLTGTPSLANVGATANIIITVTDGTDSASLSPFTITVLDDGSGNVAPTISGNPASQVLANSAYSFTPQASDADGDTLSFSIANKPSWATFNTASGRLAGTPTLANVGATANIVISVTDGTDSASLSPFTITVLDDGSGNVAPTISGNPASQVLANSAYSFTPQASDADGDVLSFSIANKPSWATFNTTSGALTGTPTLANVGATANIVISVSDGTDSASLSAFTITVLDDGSGNVAPTISGNPASQVVANSAYSFTPQASDADGDVLTFSVQGLPAWATFSTSNGRISGTPGDADVGSYSGISITVSDGAEAATLGPFTITVQAMTFGSATLTWTPPTLNTDGSALTDLAGYNIYWGATSGNYTETVALDNPGLSSYVVENLTSGNWYFVMTAVNADGIESGYSGEALKNVQ